MSDLRNYYTQLTNEEKDDYIKSLGFNPYKKPKHGSSNEVLISNTIQNSINVQTNNSCGSSSGGYRLGELTSFCGW
jgi:hypothetical protein